MLVDISENGFLSWWNIQIHFLFFVWDLWDAKENVTKPWTCHISININKWKISYHNYLPFHGKISKFLQSTEVL